MPGPMYRRVGSRASPSSSIKPGVVFHVCIHSFQVSTLLPPLPSNSGTLTMEGEPSLELEDFVSTPIDLGFLLPSPSYDLPPVQPSHITLDQYQSAVAVALESWKPPDSSSTPTDLELVQNYLHPATQRMPGKIVFDDMKGRIYPSVVNARLPYMNPCDLPGFARKDRRREKYYLTDQTSVYYGTSFSGLETPNGFWKSRDFGSAIRGEDDKIVGTKSTAYFYTGRNPRSKTYWVMDIYYLMNDKFIENGLALCHVFEDDSPVYGNSPKCSTFHQGNCNGKQCSQPFNVRSSESLNSTPSRSLPRYHHPDSPLDPRYSSYIANLENLLLCDPDPDTSIGLLDTENCIARTSVPPTGDHGQSKKRKKKSSDVWNYFTKMFVRDFEGNVLTLAACNHCSKVLTGSSKGGTTHLARHVCPCKFKPVEAGRMDKGYANGNVPPS
ncbi:hypothetical protein ACQ4PT_018967 [Festuca glaucescens]